MMVVVGEKEKACWWVRPGELGAGGVGAPLQVLVLVLVLE